MLGAMSMRWSRVFCGPVGGGVSLTSEPRTSCDHRGLASVTASPRAHGPASSGRFLGNAYTTNNYGVSGTTLLKKGDVPYWNTQQFTDSHTVNPNIVVIMLGTNDSKPQNWGTHSGEYATDYEALIDSYTVLASHPRIFLNLPPPAGTNGFGISGTIIENEILPLVRQTATKKGTGLIDIFSAFRRTQLRPDSMAARPIKFTPATQARREDRRHGLRGDHRAAGCRRARRGRRSSRAQRCGRDSGRSGDRWNRR